MKVDRRVQFSEISDKAEEIILVISIQANLFNGHCSYMSKYNNYVVLRKYVSLVLYRLS